MTLMYSESRVKERAAPGANIRRLNQRANEAEDQRRILFERSELCSRPERSELIQATARVSERRVLPAPAE